MRPNVLFDSALHRLRECDRTVQALRLILKGIDNEQVQSIADALQPNNALETIDLSLNRGIGASGVRALTAALIRCRCSTLTSLSLCQTSLKDAGAHVLASFLTATSSLKYLYLSATCIGNVGAKALARALRNNSTLYLLHLCANPIGNQGAAHLAAALRVNSALRILGLDCWKIDSACIQLFVDALSVNMAVITISLPSNVDCRLLDAALSRNYNIQLRRFQHKERAVAVYRTALALQNSSSALTRRLCADVHMTMRLVLKKAVLCHQLPC